MNGGSSQDPNDPFVGASISAIRGAASDIVKNVSEKSTLFDEERDAIFPRFEVEELVLGRVLGRGGFCVVSEIKDINLIESSRAALSEKQIDASALTGQEAAYRKEFSRQFIAGRCLRQDESKKKKDARYAIKRLSEDCMDTPHLFLKGTIDLAIEARFLAVLEHPNIIKMRATAAADPFQDGYFLVLDRLYDTLGQRFRKWKDTDRNSKGVMGALSKGKKRQKKLNAEKLSVAYDLACGLRFMHRKKIIYRDLKPENIGFDVRDDVKIFDFGLAKELPQGEKEADGTYKMTGFTGSLRYMAPEVAKNLPYNLSADVYSFGILFWQIMSLEPPFPTYSCKMHDDLVVHKGHRPACHKSWPSEWSGLMRKCWSSTPSERPTFEQITDLLSEEVNKFGPSEVSETLDVSLRGKMNA